jgi:sulfatase maturation enzyme AslB (radical SAM superfamily)
MTVRPFSNKSIDDKIFGKVWKRDTFNTVVSENNLSGKYCSKLFNSIEITHDGSCWLCCPAWLPYRIGNILTDDFETEIWNGDKAKLLRNQVFTGNWQYCDAVLCPFISSNTLPDLSSIDNDHHIDDETRNTIKSQKLEAELPVIISFSEDESCNLRCPSCRTKKIMYDEGSEEYKRRLKINQKIIDTFLSKPSTRQMEIVVTGSGDPFASKIYRTMLQNINGDILPNLRVKLLTNGVMFTEKMWDSLHKIHKNLGHIRISFDAGTKSTYENITRIGGHWEQLIENVMFLNQQSKTNPRIKLAFDFVVQAGNFKEMPEFVKLIKNICDNYSSINFSMLADWGTWNKEDFEKRTIVKQNHTQYNEFLDVLRDPLLKTDRVYLNNLTPLYNLANGN